VPARERPDFLAGRARGPIGRQPESPNEDARPTSLPSARCIEPGKRIRGRPGSKHHLLLRRSKPTHADATVYCGRGRVWSREPTGRAGSRLGAWQASCSPVGRQNTALGGPRQPVHPTFFPAPPAILLWACGCARGFLLGPASRRDTAVPARFHEGRAESMIPGDQSRGWESPGDGLVLAEFIRATSPAPRPRLFLRRFFAVKLIGPAIKASRELPATSRGLPGGSLRRRIRPGASRRSRQHVRIRAGG